MPSTVGYPKQGSELSSREATEAVRLASEQLELGKRFRQQEREALWKRNERQYEGSHWEHMDPLDDPTADRITVNVSFSTINTIVPYVTGEEPHFLVEPFSGDASPRLARIQAALLNRMWRSSDVEGQNKLEDTAVDMLMYGDGFMQVGHEVVEKRLNDGDHVEAATLVLDRLDPWDVWIDPTSDGIHNARWVCRRIITTFEELEDDERFRIPKDLSHGASNEFFVEDDKLRERMFVRGEDDTTLQWIILYEFYDLVRDYMITFAEGTEFPLRWIEEPELPIVQFGNYRIPRQPYHMSELEQLWDMQQELNKTRSEMVTHRRRNVAKIAYLKDAITEEGEAALTSDVVNAGVPFEGDGGQGLDQLIQPLNMPSLSADSYNVSDLITRDVYEISGVNEYLRGATPEVRRTATEATIIEGASNVKSRHKLRLIEKGTRKVGQLMLDIMADTFPQTEYDELGLYLTGSDAQAISRMEHGEQIGALMEQGAPEEEIANVERQSNSGVYTDVAVNPNDDLFTGTYEVFVEQHSTELRNPVMKEQRAREMFLVVAGQAQVLQMQGVTVNLRKLLERWFETAGIDDVDGMFESTGGMNAMMQQMQQAQPGQEQSQTQAGPGGDPTNILESMGLLDSENTGQLQAV